LKRMPPAKVTLERLKEGGGEGRGGAEVCLESGDWEGQEENDTGEEKKRGKRRMFEILSAREEPGRERMAKKQKGKQKEKGVEPGETGEEMDRSAGGHSAGIEIRRKRREVNSAEGRQHKSAASDRTGGTQETKV